MDELTALDRAGLEFERRLQTVAADQAALPTDCGDWTVRNLIDHIIGANRMAIVLLGGGTREESIAQMALSAQDSDLVVAFVETARAQAAAFRSPGALDSIVAHPMGEIPASRLLEFRIIDLAVHGWDLARATGGDLDLDPELVAFIWDRLSPRAAHLSETGVFGEGASGSVPEDAPLQARLLDITGRRP